MTDVVKIQYLIVATPNAALTKENNAPQVLSDATWALQWKQMDNVYVAFSGPCVMQIVINLSIWVSISWKSSVHLFYDTYVCSIHVFWSES